MTCSSEGLGQMSRNFHRFIRKHICRGKFRDASRPVLINNWEATYFGFNEEKLLRIAADAQKIGVDLMVLDDGWFGKRNSDNCSLGDWVVNRDKLPGGLDGLAQKINDMGMKFGLWFEPEMISPDSDLYRAHPDWCIHAEGRSRTQGRRQLILDLSKDEVCDYILTTLTGILDETPIAYIKWDMNRNMAEVPHPSQPHRYMLNLYRILQELTTRYPDVLFESCSGGGGRFDAGMLCYMPQIWTSDDTDAVERLYIQEGTSLCYPISTMGAHISAVPNHQVGRVTPLLLRSAVAMMGRFGLELDLNKLPEEELRTLTEQIAFYKAHEELIHHGDLYRLVSAYGSRYAAWQILAEDKNSFILFFFSITGRPNQEPVRIRLQGLDSEAIYEEENGKAFSGATLMQAGLAVDTRFDMKPFIRIFRKK